MFTWLIEMPLMDLIRQALMCAPQEVQWMFAMCAFLTLVWVCTCVVEQFLKGTK